MQPKTLKTINRIRIITVVLMLLPNIYYLFIIDEKIPYWLLGANLLVALASIAFTLTTRRKAKNHKEESS